MNHIVLYKFPSYPIIAGVSDFVYYQYPKINISINLSIFLSGFTKLLSEKDSIIPQFQEQYIMYIFHNSS